MNPKEVENYKKYGDFSKDGTEFIIRKPDTPRPWTNFLSNEKYCLQISQTASGYSFYLDAEKNHITRWAPGNYLTDEPGRYIYINDTASSDCWNAVKSKTKYSCRHGLGYTTIASEHKKVETEVTFFVPFGFNCELWKVKIRNKDNKKKTLSVMPFVEWMPGNYFADLSVRNVHMLMNRGHFDKKTETIKVSRFPWGNKPWPYEAYMSMSLPVKSYDIDLEKFVGRYGNYSSPEGAVNGKLSNSDNVMGVNMVGALQSQITLKAGEEKSFTVIVGTQKSKNEYLSAIKKFRSKSATEYEFQKTKQYWRNAILNNITVETPDKEFDLAVNIWLKYQIYINNHWGRSATYYHEGGGEFGYRNTAQDAWSIVPINAQYALKRLIKLSEHQWKTGQPMPGWSLESGATMHKPPSDFPIWLPMLLMAYVKETGDLKILDKKVKFSDGPASSLYEHSKRATMFLLNIAKSKRGLPLMGTQDWNDAFDRTGIGGKGESVWLGMGLCVALNNMQELSLMINDKKTNSECKKGYDKMRGIINKYAWDGGWYCYAFNDYGEPVGSKKNKEGKIQLNSQTWAIMAKLPNEKQLKSMLHVIDKDLETPYGPVLFTPCYTEYNGRIGRITAFAPGTKENAACFCHGGAFKIVSDTIIGRGNEAYKTFRQLLPMSLSKDIESYKSEPYILPEYIIGPGNPNFGEGAFTWLTGSADWLFVAGTQHILGIKPEIEGLLIDPCLPDAWQKVKISRHFRGCNYEIVIRNPKGRIKGVKYLIIDGIQQDSNLVKTAHGKKSCKIEVIM